MPQLAHRLGCVALALGAAWGGGAPAAAAEPAGSGAIYTCIDDRGRRITADRPIPECHGRDQRQLNADGSLKRVVPPTPTADERAEREARERRAAEARAAAADAVRRDRNLLLRYPSEERHRKAREAALEPVRAAIAQSQSRLAELAVERKPLLSEAEFYEGKALPLRLKLLMDANGTSTEAQRQAAANQQAELVRINSLYDAELARLKRLWAGAAPGSLGPLAPAAQAAASAASAR